MLSHAPRAAGLSVTDTQRSLIEDNLDLARILAIQAAKRNRFGSDTEYTLSDAYLALTECGVRYDAQHAKGASFRTFAGRRIAGAVIDSVRESRRGRGFSRAERGRPPRQRVEFCSLHAVDHMDELFPYQGRDPYAACLDAEQRRILRRVLTPREHFVVLRLLAGDTQEQIGAVLRIGQSRVAQLKVQAVAKVRASLSTERTL